MNDHREPPAATEYSPVDTKVAESGLVCIVHPSCRSRCNPEVTGSVIFGLHGETHGSLYQALSAPKRQVDRYQYHVITKPWPGCQTTTIIQSCKSRCLDRAKEVLLCPQIATWSAILLPRFAATA
ncbi:hypothetical protein CIHG_06522 [Coccidioides immitis H538.4]|uniref:Uncharacterized protein n=2 Tax=Coccidioides immitis TaxID=5501 RepID=A0A0J8RWT4_COCIT|nr:hypothetical protein CIRG_07936 [Coccidioides immitis RMSCC 2394]KMU88584.1 hypothetical protein CIHG_06522 [Coccidioides immitis H538.4]